MNLKNPKEVFHTLFVKKAEGGLIQFIRYGFVGGIAFLADYATLVLLTHYGHAHYLISNSLGFVVGLLVNYWLSIRWAFGTRAMTSSFHEFAFFGVIGLIGLGMNDLVMWLLTDLAGIHYAGSKLFATAIVFLWNFFARKRLVFGVNALRST